MIPRIVMFCCRYETWFLRQPINAWVSVANKAVIPPRPMFLPSQRPLAHLDMKLSCASPSEGPMTGSPQLQGWHATCPKGSKGSKGSKLQQKRKHQRSREPYTPVSSLLLKGSKLVTVRMIGCLGCHYPLLRISYHAVSIGKSSQNCWFPDLEFAFLRGLSMHKLM